jgi:voltage-gated potassium channel
MTDWRRGDYLERVERWTELPLTILSLLLVPLLLAESVFSLSAGRRDDLRDLDYLIWGIFAADLIVKLSLAPNRRRYLRGHWTDALLVAIPVLRPLRAMRSIRALRLLRVSRSGIALMRFVVGLRRVLSKHGLQYVLAVALVVVVASGLLVTSVEKTQPDSNIHNVPDGLWWAVSTVTTVGYGDTYPHSAVGRGIGVALMLLGISLFGVITASVAALFVEDQESDLRREIRELRGVVQSLVDKS